MEIKQQTSGEYGISQELEALSILINYGSVSIPYGNSSRYDCILDIKNHFYRIQIKGINFARDKQKILIRTSNTRMSANGVVNKIYTKEDIDYIGFVYNHQMYLIDPEMAKKEVTIRLEPPKLCNQHYIEDYTINKVLGIELKTWDDLKQENRILNDAKKEQKKYCCKICGAPVSKEDGMCVSCSHIAQRKVDRPDRVILKEEIRTMPFTKISEKYGVTDNAVRKWCDAYGLPRLKKEIDKISDDNWRSI